MPDDDHVPEMDDEYTHDRERVDMSVVRPGVRAALSALTGQRPDVETAVAELERVQKVLDDDAGRRPRPRRGRPAV